MKTSILAVAVSCAAVMAIADYAVPFPVGGGGISTWTGLDADNPNVWSAKGNWGNDCPCPPVWYLHGNGYNWYLASFNLSSAATINMGSYVSTDNYGPFSYGAWGLCVESGSKQLTIEPGDVSNKKFTFFSTSGGAGQSGTSFVNYSDYPVIFNLPVCVYGWRAGKNGVLPGAVYNDGFSYEYDNGSMAFFAGDPARSDEMNTSVFKAAVTSTKPVEVQENHVVKIDGASAYMTADDVSVAGKLIISGGTFNAVDLATTGSGVIELDDGAKLVAGKDISGVNFSISGSVTIDNGAYNVDLSGATFAEGSVLKRTGSGTIALPASGTLPFVVANYSTTMDESGRVKSTWQGGEGGAWDVASNWSDSTVPVWDTWRITQFNLADATSTKLGTTDTLAAWGLFVGDSSKQLTIDETPNGYNELRFYMQGNETPHTSFINYSAYPVVFNVVVSLNGYRYGSSGVLPGAIYNKGLVYSPHDGSQPLSKLVFFAGDPLLPDERNTSIVSNSALVAKSGDTRKNLEVQDSHIVRVEGLDSSIEAGAVTVSGTLIVQGGTVDCASFARETNGAIVLKGATVNATMLPSGTVIGEGLTTLNYGSEDITLGSITFAEGGMLKLNGTGTVALADATVAHAGTLLFGSDAMLSHTGGDLNVNYPIHGSGTVTVSLDSGRSLTLSSTVSGSVSLDCSGVSTLSFGSGFEWTSTGTLMLPDGTVVQGPFTWMKSAAGWGEDYTAAEHWSDGEAMAGDSNKTYLDYGFQARTVNYAENEYEYEFPSGAKLVLAGSSSSYASLEPKASKITIANLTLGGCSQLKFSGGGMYSNGDEELYGAVTVASSESAPAKFLSGDGRHDKIYAQISGSGKIIFEHYGSSGTVTLGGNNGGYTGSMEIVNGATVRISAANQLGGEPSTVQERGLVLANGSTVEFTSNFTVDQWNRGLYIDGAGTVNSSAQVVWFGPVGFSDGATLTKKGDGELVILGSCSAGTVRLEGFGRAIKFKADYADIVNVESGLPGYRVVRTPEDNYNMYRLEKIRGLKFFVY